MEAFDLDTEFLVTIINHSELMSYVRKEKKCLFEANDRVRPRTWLDSRPAPEPLMCLCACRAH